MSIDTERFRTELLQERRRVQNAIGNLRESHPGSPDDETDEVTGTGDNHVGDAATATLGREIEHTLGENSEQILSEINGALERIEEGTYGTCTACGGEIGELRLDAYPWASLCIDDARKAERR
jgi:RNA polymerase-binding protein DksA